MGLFEVDGSDVLEGVEGVEVSCDVGGFGLGVSEADVFGVDVVGMLSVN
jgi:hypothetical protein